MRKTLKSSFFDFTISSLCLPDNNALRIQLGETNKLPTFKSITQQIKDKYEPYHIGKLTWSETTEPGTQNLVLPPWLCQPYVRIEPQEHIKLVEEKRKEPDKRQYEDSDGNPISRKRMKKLRRIARRPEKPEGVVCGPKGLNLCSAENCVNPLVNKMRF